MYTHVIARKGKQ